MIHILIDGLIDFLFEDNSETAGKYIDVRCAFPIVVARLFDIIDVDVKG